MAPDPTGYIRGNDLILKRTFRAPIDDVWTSLTSSKHTALWFGGWEGDSGPGKVVRLQLRYEEGQPWTNLMIEECEAPRRLVVTMKDDYGEWRIELTLTQTNDKTELRFVQPLSDRKAAGDIAPGWEYYLDMLVAAREGKTLPSFEDYYPSQKAHYLAFTDD
ncbi:SRPBCC family protein [Rhizobium bangladeshense]|uniref:SRPBCC family protein n=1 Tax=Rhizobium bangladeshense TaxID=1138189 RepID=A0ABS7LCN1_9HYPH|nr:MULTISPECIES: SRPBCC family protein [Rhizobium]MBX4874304.1 SRPBCC family protein [Rhizobium bangladeshense]MBX4883813.1 SRPBCC family protein [Rhizobium bangladeshense]MBY3589098.1 SRPBCC family protein [Rhizobium bangladeshense]MBY3598795.1 SRPBCC family protein [Rhizobium bangladeshense]TLX14444.1 SRPBCC family protein [Rhizobium sp. MHM7A]